MVDVAKLQELLGRAEGPTLDFKKEDYRLQDQHGRGEFIKDILAMANTPRDTSAFIVIGAKSYPNGHKDLHGLATSRDDTEYQDVIKAKTHPCPIFLYTPIGFDGKVFGIIEIQPERRGPYQAKDDIGPTRRHVVYWRRGSQNDEANPDEQELIRQWCTNRAVEKVNESFDPASTPWDAFLRATYEFHSERLYMLLAAPISGLDTQRLAGVGYAPWNMVVDLDPRSDESGLASVAQSVLRERRQLHEVILGDRPSIHINHSCYWYFAHGLRRRPTSLVADDWRQWRGKYGRDLRAQMEMFATVAGAMPVTVVVALSGPQPSLFLNHLDTVLGAILDAFGTSVEIVLVGPTVTDATDLLGRYEVTAIPIDLQHLGEGLQARFSAVSTTQGSELALPTRAGTTVTVASQYRLWIEEELEVVGATTGLREDEGRDTGNAFLRGALISWFEVGLNYDIARDVTPKLIVALRRDLGLGTIETRSSPATRVNIYHVPGAGGSTVARRALWEMHSTVPCVVLHSSVPSETTDRLQYIFHLTGLPPLVLVESAEITERQIDDLFSNLRARQTPAVLLLVVRRFGKPFVNPSEHSRTFFLESTLSPGEAERMAHVLGRTVPARRSRLQQLVKNGDERDRTAFYFALETFEEQFEGLASYVSRRLNLSDVQRDIVVFLSIAYHYGQHALLANSFSGLLGFSRSQVVDLEKALGPDACQLLRRDNDGRWRPAHALIAQEIIHQVLSPSSVDRRVWNQNLSTWAMRFVEFCRGDVPIPSSEMVELIARCFLYRDNRDLLGREVSQSSGMLFSQLIEDIPAVEGRQVVLEHVANLFPEEAHFWGHLGRFYSMEVKIPRKAIEAIDRAISISPDDHVLYHMKGMALRSECYGLMDTLRRGQAQNAIELVAKSAELAAEQFQRARDLGPDDEHAYISHIQMLLHVVDFATRVQSSTPQGVLTSASVPPLVRESIDLAEGLLDQVRRLREGERLSQYAERCLVELDSLYGRYDTVLQGWDSLLARQDVYRPPIRRQLVRAYLARHNRQWEKLAAREVRRITDLLEENLNEEPNDERNIRLWVQAVRRVHPPVSMSRIVERVTYWKSNSSSLDAVYYLYVLHVLEALEGSSLALRAMADAVEECRRRARSRRNRTGSFEWVGKGHDLQRLVHYTELGDWEQDKGFWQKSELLQPLHGSIASIQGPEAGWIETEGGVRAFFVPGKSNHVQNRDENRAVLFYLGFSYDGPRAWEVKNR